MINSHCDILKNKITKITDKFKDDIEDVLSVYKTEIDECLYYLSDEFQSTCDWDGIDIPRILSNSPINISYQFKVSFDEISKFSSECLSAISRLEAINAKFIITFQYKREDGMLFSPQVSNIKSKRSTLDFIIQEVNRNEYILDFTVGIVVGADWDSFFQGLESEDNHFNF